MDLTRQLRGQRIAYLATNGRLLSIQLDDGQEIVVGWVDDNGKPISGKPVIERRGRRVNARGLADMLHIPPEFRP